MTNIYRPLSQKLLTAAGQNVGGIFYIGTFNSAKFSLQYEITDIDVSAYTEQLNQGGWEVYVEWRECYESSNESIQSNPIATQMFGEVWALNSAGQVVEGDVPFPTNLAWGDGMMRGKSFSYSTIPRAWITGEPPQVPLGAEFPNMSLQLNKDITTIQIRAKHNPGTIAPLARFVDRFAAVYLVKLPFPYESLPPAFEPTPPG